MAENVLAMTLRMRNHAVTVARNTRGEVDKLTKSGSRLGTQFGKSVKATRTSVQGLMGSMVSLKTIIVATFAYRIIQRFGRFLGSLTDLFKEQEKASLKLAYALAAQGNYTREGVQELSKYASELQYVVAIDNEMIEAQMGLFAAYGMNVEQIKEALMPAINLHVARNIELKAAVDLVGKAFVGYTGTLSRYGIIIEAGLSKEEKYRAALEKLATSTGVAAGVATKYTGQIDIMSAAYDDFKKQLGAVIARGLLQSGILARLTEGWKNLGDKMKEYEPYFAFYAEVLFLKLETAIKSLYKTMTSKDALAWLITVSNIIQILYRMTAQFLDMVSTGLGQISDSLADIFIMLAGYIKIIRSSVWEIREVYKNTMYDLNLFHAETIDRMEKRMDAYGKRTAIKQKAWFGDFKAMYDIWGETEEGGPMGGPWKSAMMNKLAEERNRYMEDYIKNQKVSRGETEKIFQLTKNMAQQFAMASRLEQEQTKYMLSRLSTMTAEDVGSLTEMERALISKQSVLKASYEKLFGEYAEKRLGIEMGYEIKTKLEIDLTDRAAESFKAREIETEKTTNRNVERLAG